MNAKGHLKNLDFPIYASKSNRIAGALSMFRGPTRAKYRDRDLEEVVEQSPELGASVTSPTPCLSSAIANHMTESDFVNSRSKVTSDLEEEFSIRALFPQLWRLLESSGCVSSCRAHKSRIFFGIVEPRPECRGR